MVGRTITAQIQIPFVISFVQAAFLDTLFQNVQAFLTLAEAGYDVAPCGSNCYGVTENFPDMTEYCHEKIAPERLKGMIMAPWIKTIPEYRRLHWQAADIMAEAIRRAQAVKEKRA